MSFFTTSQIARQVIVPGVHLWRREKRVLLRRWKRAMLLPETVLLAVILIGGSYASDHFRYGPGPQQAMAAAAVGVVQDGVPTPTSKRRNKVIQDILRGSPEDLVHLTGADMVAAFGYADLDRRDGSATILQFRGTHCVLDVYLNDAKPVHYEFRARRAASAHVGDGTIRARSCVNDILKSRRT